MVERATAQKVERQMEKTVKVTNAEFKTSAKNGKRFKSITFDDGSRYNWFRATPAFNVGETYKFLEVQSGDFVNMDKPTLIESGAPSAAETVSGMSAVCPHCGNNVHLSISLSTPMMSETPGEDY